jgi:hypothetical protein
MKQFYELPTIHISCDCYTHLLKLTYDQEDDGTDLLYVSFYEEGQPRYKEGWKQRFRHIWNIIKYGTPFADMICLNKYERLQLTEYLNKLNESN